MTIMKKIAVLSTILILLSSFAANAEGLVVKGGLTYQRGSRLNDIKLDSFSSWHFGAGYQTDSHLGFTLQPELIYNVKGVALKDAVSVRMNYLELPVNIQWGIDLLLLRPFIFASPYIGYSLGHKYSTESPINAQIEEALNNLEYGFGLGYGLEIGKLQITAKYNWNFGELLDLNEYVGEVKGLDINSGFLQVSLGLAF